jgi:fucose permease
VTAQRTASALLLAIAFLAFISIGFPDAVLGVAWPSMRETFDRPRADLGFILFGAGAGYFSSGALSGKAIERLGVGHLLTFSTALVAVGLIGYAIAPSFWFIVVVAAMIGFGSGAVDAGLNFYASEHFSVTVMNLLHAFFGVGAMVGPFIMAGVLASGASWRSGYVIVGSVIAAMAVTFVFTSGAWSANGHQGDHGAPRAAPMREILRKPLVWLQILLFFIMTGIEAGAGAWAYTILYERFNMDAGVAGIWAGAYWGALALGRLVLPTLSRGMKPARLVQMGTYGLLAGGLLMTRDAEGVYLAGLLLFGFSMAPMFPTLMSLTPVRLGSNVSIHAIGFQVSAAVLGVAAVPTLAGVLSERYGLVAIPWTLAIGAVILIGVETSFRTLADRTRTVA